jgi:hypothetical protein
MFNHDGFFGRPIIAITSNIVMAEMCAYKLGERPAPPYIE